MKSESTGTKVSRVLDTIEQLTGQGGLYQGLYDHELVVSPKVCPFCRVALTHPIAASLCRVSCRNATLNAMTSGEPYYYRCWANLLIVVIPVAPHNRCGGGIELGGFCASGEQLEIRQNLLQLAASWPPSDPAPFLDTIPALPQIAPSALRGLGILALENTFSSGLNSSEFFRRQNEKYLQQRRIAEAFADIRKEETGRPDILGDTYQLMAFLAQNDKAGAMAFMSKYLAKLLMASNWNQTRLKAHVRVLLAVMTSQSILSGTPWPVATSREMRQMLRLENATTTEESCYEVAEWIQEYFAGRDAEIHQDGRPLGERVAAWLHSHYQETITLATVSRAVGASSSTLVHRLPRETGKTFKQLLTEIRIAEAKKLLATTSLDISGIGDLCGFFDQSHFTREFKRSLNLTPGQFRKLLAVPEEALRTPDMQSLDETEPLHRATSTQRKKKGGKRASGKQKKISKRRKTRP